METTKLEATKRNPDILLGLAIFVIAFAVVYIAFCWAAKIMWGIEPPEGTSLTAIAAIGGQLLVGGGIQIFKKAGKSDKVKELETENKKLTRQLSEAQKSLEKVQKAVG